MISFSQYLSWLYDVFGSVVPLLASPFVSAPIYIALSVVALYLIRFLIGGSLRV